MRTTFILSTALTLLAPLFTEASTCTAPDAPKAYTSIKKTVDAEIKTFSNKKAVAQIADQTLSKLISAKSPVITAWMSKRNLETEPEDKIVKDWRDYYARNFILTKYPQGNAEIDKEIEKLMESINKSFTQKDFKKRMQSLFTKSQNASMDLVKTFPIPDASKEKILARIQSIQLYWMKDFKSSKYNQLPLDFLDWGIAYDPAANEINMGVNSLAYPNEETYLAVFLHEIGHSFDSCRWAYFDGEWPFQKIGECLRSAESVGAKKRDDSKLEVLTKSGKIPPELSTSLKANPTCNKLIYPAGGLQADQLPESFADWFSAEALATLKNIKAANIRNDLCAEKALSEGSSYVTNELRMNAIYFVHPKFKKSGQKNPSNTKYCTWESTVRENL